MGKNLTDFSFDIFSLKGKVAMITGANQGLGMAYAVALAKAGADIFIPHFTDDVSRVKEIVEGFAQPAVSANPDISRTTFCTVHRS